VGEYVKISIVIPVYNEFRNIHQVLERVAAAPLPTGCSKEIIVVDDGSVDGTTEILDQYDPEAHIVIHHSVLNLGKGSAIRIGLRKATGDIILVQDGDLEYNPAEYPSILQPLVDGSAQIVYGSRFQGSPQGMKLANWVANKLLTWTTNILFHARITDEATAYKAFRADVVRSVRLHCRRFEFCPEVTAKLLRAGYKIHEVPISYNARGLMEGKKIRWQDGVQAMWTLMKYRVAPRQSFVTAPSVRMQVSLTATGRYSKSSTGLQD
jgi:glycosyltransferase involved in cell wall biosynthesis